LEAFFELLNVEGALTQNKRMFPTALFWAIQILRFKKVCQMISKHYETGFVKNHRTLGAEALLEGWMVRMEHKE